MFYIFLVISCAVLGYQEQSMLWLLLFAIVGCIGYAEVKGWAWHYILGPNPAGRMISLYVSQVITAALIYGIGWTIGLIV